MLAGDSADVLLVSAALDGGAGLFLVDAGATSRTGYRTFDGQRGADITFDLPCPATGRRRQASAVIAEAVIRFQSRAVRRAVGAWTRSRCA